MARTNGTAPAKMDRSEPPALRVKAVLEQAEARIAKVLPKHMTPEKVIQVVTTLVHRTPDLQRCTPVSILTGVLEGSELGLSFSRSSGEAYLVPFGQEATFIPGYRGLVKLAYQGGRVLSIQGRLVRQGDDFAYAYLPDLEFRHVPHLGDEAKRPVIYSYAYARLSGGEPLVEVLPTDEVEAVRKRSRAGRNGPWVTDWGEMAKKTALRRLCKILPRSEELDRAIECDDRQYLDTGSTVTVSAPPGNFPTRSAALAHQLRNRGLPIPEPEPEFAADEGVGQPVYSEADEPTPEPTEDEDYEPGSRG